MRGFPHHGSSKPKGSRAGRSAISIGASRPEPVRAIAVYESERDGCTRGAETRVSGDRLPADRFAGDLDPLFPFIGALWFLVSVQQQSPAERTAAVLRLKDAQPGLVQRGFAAASPFGPVPGQGRIVWRREALDHLVPDDGCPGELGEVGAALTVTEHPPVFPGFAERTEVPVNNPSIRLVRVASLRPAEGELPHVSVQVDIGLLGHHAPVIGGPGEPRMTGLSLRITAWALAPRRALISAVSRSRNRRTACLLGLISSFPLRYLRM